MNKPTYQVKTDEENSFYFLSIGKKGIILKMVELAEISESIYNIGFGDYDFTTNTINDKIKSNNSDAEKVLATVLGILSEFLHKNPTKTVFFNGSDLIRTRLYQKIINLYFDELTHTFEIFGGVNHEFELFQKNKNYESFLIKIRSKTK